jgi:O-antigen/teichoic acid export membrane protein
MRDLTQSPDEIRKSSMLKSMVGIFGSFRTQSLYDALFVYGNFALRYASLLFLVPYYARTLGVDAYGVVLSAMSVMALVWLVVNFGFSVTGARDVASCRTSEEVIQKFGAQLSARFIMLPFALLIGFVGTVVSPVLAANWRFGVLATILGCLNGFNLGWLFQGLKRYAISTFLEAITLPITILLVLFTVKSQADGGFVLGSLLVASAISAVFGYCFAFSSIGVPRLRVPHGIAEIRDAWTIFVQSLNSTVMTSGSTFLLSGLSDATQVAFFGSVERVIAIVLAFFQPTSQLLLPAIARLKLKNLRDSIFLGFLAVAIEILVGFLAAAILWILSPYITFLIFGASIEVATRVLCVLAWSIPLAAVTHGVGTYFMVPFYFDRWIAIAATAGNICNIVLILVLAADYGSVGVAFARVGGETISAILMLAGLRALWKRHSDSNLPLSS